jgi:ribosome-associated translation inhibitor RaiA
MELPLQLTFRNMEPSESIAARIRDRAGKLDRHHRRIVGCGVVVESPHRHHRCGRLYHVRVELTVPRGELLVRRGPTEHHAHRNVYVAIRDAFDAAARRLDVFGGRHGRRGKGE